ncbi:hypothetical protein Tco_0942834, partial [Tanacetum coccineum]
MGSAREYVALLEKLAGLVGVPEIILEGTFIKGLKQDLRAVVRVLNPEGLSHAMKLAVNCPSREGMEGKSFEEGLAEITDTLKRLQSTLLFHQTKLKESFRQARRDISLATEKLHRSIKAAIKEEVNHEEQFDFLGVQLNQRIPNRTVKARKVKARLFWRKFIVTIDRTRRPKSIKSVVMLRLGYHHPSVARGNIRVLGLNVQRVRQHPPRLVYQVCYWPILHYKGNQRQIWDPGITWLKISKEHLEDKVANNQTFEEQLKAIKEVTLMVRNLSTTVDGSLQVMKKPVTEAVMIAPCYDDLGRLYSTKSGAAREKKKIMEETTFHESNKLDLGLGSGAYGKDANYHEFMDDSVMEEIYIASLVMVMAEDLGQKRIHDSSETAMVLGSQGKSNEIGYFNGPIGLRHCAANRKRK